MCQRVLKWVGAIRKMRPESNSASTSSRERWQVVYNKLSLQCKLQKYWLLIASSSSLYANALWHSKFDQLLSKYLLCRYMFAWFPNLGPIAHTCTCMHARIRVEDT